MHFRHKFIICQQKLVYSIVHFVCNLNLSKTSSNIGILLNGVLRPILLKKPFASYSFINLNFLLPHIAYFDDNIVLPFLVFNTFESIFSIFFYTLNNISTCFIMTSI